MMRTLADGIALACNETSVPATTVRAASPETGVRPSSLCWRSWQTPSDAAGHHDTRRTTSAPWDVALPEPTRALAGVRPPGVLLRAARRQYVPLPHLQHDAGAQPDGRGDLGLYFFLSDLRHLDEIAELAELLVICRTRYDDRVSEVMDAFRGRASESSTISTISSRHHYADLIQRTLDQDLRRAEAWDYWFAYSSRLGATLRLCDGAITTNESLAARIREFADIPTSVVPNS